MLTDISDHQLQSKKILRYRNPSLSHTKSKQAAVAWGAGEPLSIEDIEVAPPKANEVRIQVHHTGVCHTGLSGPVQSTGEYRH